MHQLKAKNPTTNYNRPAINITPLKVTMNKKVILCAWICATSIIQIFLDKVIFPENDKIQYREMELYRPRADFEYKLTELLKSIRTNQYYEKLNIENTKRTIDTAYIHTLLEYHREIVQLYDVAGSKEILLALQEMGTDIVRMSKSIGYNTCVPSDQFSNFNTSAKEIAPLIDKLSSIKENILNFDEKIRKAKPDHLENGKFDTEAAAEKVRLLIELMKDPYLYVRFNNKDPISDFQKYINDFDTIHETYRTCAANYAERNEHNNHIKLFYQIMTFLILTILMYRKDLL
ncbi:hypothetical protein [Pseudomonas sp. S2_F03]